MEDIKYNIYTFVLEYWKYLFTDRTLDISNIKLIDPISEKEEEEIQIEIQNNYLDN